MRCCDECDRDDCPGTGAQFFVSVVDGERFGLLLGPYASHAEALGQVRRGRELADRADPRSHWYGFGTARLPKDHAASTVFGR